MSGHNKWSTIKYKKGAADAKRGKLFSRLIKEISMASKEGGGDPGGNPRLRTALLTAKNANMPKDNIDRAIKRGTGELEGVSYEQLYYEGYTPGGAAILIEVLTENKNRAASEVRHTFSKFGGNLGEPGSVAWMFNKKGNIVFEGSAVTEDQAVEVGLEAGAEDITASGETIEVQTSTGDLEAVKAAFERAGMAYSTAEITFVPSVNLEMEGKDLASAMRLLDALDDLDDVQRVWSNIDFSDESAALLG
ncbi:MAG: YebC/PmpR family DNA-binding transcriptional regulator [Deltaproteobacteria bacterium]|jgi:YebC/PmpR family DNA-binding regulatory protein|nr:YebC/PmpR family DNA-binding transcriptional regulator [Deltaproteobacteria bacterium]MDR1310084.1 YebC/PmpR family DNA-binding transcriptional regulator [Deltaproteobacteria bacterium]